MNNRTYLFICIICALFGSLFFAFYNEWIVIRKTASKHSTAPTKKPATKKDVVLTFWHNNTWHTETQTIIWTDNKEKNLTYLVNNWLSVINENNTVHKKTVLQAAKLAPSSYDAYISFDGNPLPQNYATVEKLHWIEGLCKTIAHNDIPLQTIHFLSDHQPMQDPHLDFSNPWPINGFWK